MTEIDWDALIEDWATRDGLSDHLALELLAGELDEGEPVPGCSCVGCVTRAAGGSMVDEQAAEWIVRRLSNSPPEQRRARAKEIVARWEERGFQLPRPGVLALLADRLPGANTARRGKGPRLPVEKAQRVSIREIARRLGLGEPERRGREWVVRCPLHHDEHPSLTFSTESGLWYCFPCDEGGDGIRLVERVKHMRFDEAVKWIVRAYSLAVLALRAS